MLRNRENHLLSYPLIVSATKGDPDAIHSVLNHFGAYIATLCRKEIYDGGGRVFYCEDFFCAVDWKIS